MTMTRRTTRQSLSAVVVMLIAAGSALTACGSSSSGSATGTLEEDTLQCAMSGEYRPFNFYGEDGELEGFDVDMCREIADRMGVEAEPVTGAFNTLIAGLKANRYDTIVGSMSDTPERAEQVDFSDPYYTTGAQLFVSPDSSIASVDDLGPDSTLGVTLGTTFEDYARTETEVGSVKTYKADIEALKDLEAGRLDAVITQGLMGRYLVKNASLGVAPAGDRLYDDVAAIPVAKGNTELLEQINEALVEINKDGTYSELSKKWFGEDISSSDG
jgi:polar amino acid transport system substrate-binding protein